MLINRIIPCLLLKDKALVKTIKFKNPIYIGDPINAVKIFNDKEVDELVILDISASKNNKIQYDLLSRIASESFMPLAYGGGLHKLEDIKRIINLGFEKISINSLAFSNPQIITEASKILGNQSVIASIDIKLDFFHKHRVYEYSKKRITKEDPVSLAKKMEELGAGEILLNSVDKDGTMEGYDIELIRKVADSVNIPVIAIGGAGTLEDFGNAIKQGRASAVAAGSMFVFHSKSRAVLINYPEQETIKKVLM